MAFQYQNAWYAIKRKLEADRVDLVEQLVRMQDELSTAQLRGKVAMLDEIIARYPSELSEIDSDDE
ncbi:hypothetical protein [Aliidiomarina maris]|uniref:Uncharacterized protein n=1 Tax=Aliidiomarina maris TaxID=531312 RepID=A0A327X4E0_9GAMM|nr:hypothetical protein [Aliidiomarina maris]RAK01611.1 hypothetical protein B0I24_101234 [Aliidiomarina maris]RUO28437.1 hypothetical protein CWE07_01120 [Aliidiomarina maris]